MPGLIRWVRLTSKSAFASERLIAILLVVKAPWPIGLRIVFWLAVLGMVVNTGQLVYYGFMLRVFPHDLGGMWAFVGYGMGLVTILMGALRLRRLFTVLVTMGCLYSNAFIAFQTWPMVRDFWQEALLGRMTPARILTWELWCLVWNTICFALNTGVLLYLLSYEFRLFGPGKIERRA